MKEVNIYDETSKYRPKDPYKVRLYVDYVSKIPERIRKHLNATCLHIISIMISMGTYTNDKGRFYLDEIFFSEEWLAKQCGKSRVHISNMIRRLEKLKLIKVTRRRLPNGRYKTNLYRLTGKLLKYLGLWKFMVKSIVTERKMRLEETTKQKIRRFKEYINRYLKGVKNLDEYLLDIAIQQENERARMLNGEITQQEYWDRIREIGRTVFFIPDNKDDFYLFKRVFNECRAM